jgi:hypothetical protein
MPWNVKHVKPRLHRIAAKDVRRNGLGLAVAAMIGSSVTTVPVKEKRKKISLAGDT